MVGRTPEYLGKKIEQKEVKMAMLALIATAASILVFTAISAVLEFPKDSYWNPQGPTIGNLNNTGPHGFAEILYAYTSGTGNNGSAFAGITRQYALVQPHARSGDAHRPLPVPAAAARRGRKPGRQETDPGHERHAADARAAVRRPAGRHGRHRRRVDILPGAVAGADRRAFPHE